MQTLLPDDYLAKVDSGTMGASYKILYTIFRHATAR